MNSLWINSVFAEDLLKLNLESVQASDIGKVTVDRARVVIIQSTKICMIR
jgi:hypothetical protein